MLARCKKRFSDRRKGLPAAKRLKTFANKVHKQGTSITFGDRVENHVGNQMSGEMADQGYSLGDLQAMKIKMEAMGIRCDIIHLNDSLPEGHQAEDAYVLVMRNFVNLACLPGETVPQDFGRAMNEEQDGIFYDSKFYNTRRKVVQNKHARTNACFADKAQEPNYEEGKGTIHAFSDLPCLDRMRKIVSFVTGDDLYAEGNRYSRLEVSTGIKSAGQGIGFHGDAERRKVFGIRLGADYPIVWWWYHRAARIGKQIRIDLKRNDAYVMGAKAVGTDWKRSSKVTLRHAAGSDAYTK